MDTASSYNEKQLLDELRHGSEFAFTQLYRNYNLLLYYNILSLVKDEHRAEELVQDIFSTIWKQRAHINIEKKLFGLPFCHESKQGI